MNTEFYSLINEMSRIKFYSFIPPPNNGPVSLISNPLPRFNLASMK
jgi:hypothetical protein